MNDELGEFVGKGFAILRKRIKEVEGRKAVDGIDGQDGKDGTNGTNGKDGGDGNDGANGSDGLDGNDGRDGENGVDGRRGPKGDEGETIRGENGDQGEAGVGGQVGPRGPKGIDGTDGKDATATDGTDGVGIADGKINAKGHLILTLTDGTKKDVGRVRGKDAQQFQGMIAGGPSGGAAVVNDWIKLTTSFSSTPTLNTALLGGSVYNYLYNSDTLTLFRYIAADGSDKFFKNFDGTNLTNLIASKAQTITL